jgi:PAS domain S-box-containing protein
MKSAVKYGIGKHKKTEEDFERTEEYIVKLEQLANLLDSVINTTPDLIFVKDHELRTILCNHMYAGAVGKKPEELYGHTDIENGWDPELVLGNPTKGIRGFENDDRDALAGKMIRNSYDPANINGEIRIFDTRKMPLKDDSGKIIGVLGIARDITEIKRAEEVLRESEGRCHSLFNHSIDGILVAEIKNRRFVAANPAICKMLGYTQEELTRLGVQDIHLPAQVGDIIKKFDLQAIGKVSLDECITVMRKDGTVFLADIYTYKLNLDGKDCLLGVFRDITESRDLEDARFKLQKLESLGTLAGGIAHDFNNLLGGVYGYIEIAARHAKDKRVSAYLEKAEQSIYRAKSLTNQLVTFATGGAPMRTSVSLSPMIEDVTNFSLIGSNVTGSFDTPPDLWHCNIDKEQVSQVLSNITINARQAMPNGGTVLVSAANIYLKDNEIGNLTEGEYVKISIRDNGVGIPKEMQKKIFDPFFTTKQTGTGLGLAITYSVIKKHDGWIDVESNPGHGSVFNIYLPASKEIPTNASSHTDSEQKSSGTVLILDDQEDLCDSLRELLGCFGYSAVCVKDGRDAVNFFIEETKAQRPLAAIILDLTIPNGMGGKETVAEIRKLDSNVSVFVSSGYYADPVIANPKAYGFTASLKKPFAIKELIRLIEDS